MTTTRKTTRTILVSAAFGMLLSVAGPAIAASAPVKVNPNPTVQIDELSASVGNDPFARFDGTHLDVNNWMQNTVEWLGGPRP